MERLAQGLRRTLWASLRLSKQTYKLCSGVAFGVYLAQVLGESFTLIGGRRFTMNRSWTSALALAAFLAVLPASAQSTTPAQSTPQQATQDQNAPAPAPPVATNDPKILKQQQQGAQGQTPQAAPPAAAAPTSDPTTDPNNTKKPKNKKDDVDEIGSRDVGKGMNWISLEKEIAIGKAMAQQVEAQSHMVDDPVITEYVNRLAQNLVRNSDAKVPFTIKVIDADEVNAFALPGGFFYVNSGLILAADEESELAGVMSHEIAHVAARHATRQMTRANMVNIASIPLIFVGGGIGYAVRS